MDRSHLERSFEPFFTTGFAGSGLGLPAAMGIVREHGGYLGLESSPGKGTIARIFLPPGK
jgi:signal transduction histidine kinase